jgi:hypothetical protein
MFFAAQNLIQGLFTTIWNHGYTHGDLTEDNLLFIGDTIKVIDWWDFLTQPGTGEVWNYDHIFRVLLDLYDVLNSIKIYSNCDSKLIAGFNMVVKEWGEDKNIFEDLKDCIKHFEGWKGQGGQLFRSGTVQYLHRINRILMWMRSNGLLPEHVKSVVNGGRRKKRKKNKTKKRRKKKIKRRKSKRRKSKRRKSKRRKSRN